MARSLISDNQGLVTFTILIEGQAISTEYRVVSIHVNRELNRVPYAKIHLMDGGVGEEHSFAAGNSDDFIPGKQIIIKAGYESDEEEIFKGIIIKHGIRIKSSGSSLMLECSHEAIKMTVGRKNEIFEKKTDSQAITSIIQKYGITKEVESTSHEHEQLVQHYVSDWDFILMRADINGLVVIPEVEKLKISKPDFAGSPKYEVRYGLTLIDIDVEVNARNQYQKATAYSWDHSNQKLIKAQGDPESSQLAGNLSSSDLASVIGLEDYIIQTPVPMPDQMLNAWSSAKLIKSKMALIQGKVTFRGASDVFPGDILELTGLSDRFNGNVFIGGVHHIIEEGSWKVEANIGLSDEWFSEITPNISAADASGNVPPVKGLLIGIVKKIDEDPDGNFRVQITLPTLQKDTPIWARLPSLYATKDAGIFFYPEENDEVIVGFLNEDAQTPVILGRLHSKKNPPPLSPVAENNEKAIITKNGLKIHFEDETKTIMVETPNSNKVIFDDEQQAITLEDEHGNLIIMNSDGITIESSAAINLIASDAINMEASQDATIVSSGGNVTIEGIEVSLTGQSKVSAEGAMAELKGSGQTTIEGGIVMIN